MYFLNKANLKILSSTYVQYFLLTGQDKDFIDVNLIMSEM